MRQKTPARDQQRVTRKKKIPQKKTSFYKDNDTDELSTARAD